MRRAADITLVACGVVYGVFLAYWYQQTIIVSIFCSFDDPTVERNYFLGYFGFPIIVIVTMLGVRFLYQRSVYFFAIICGMIPPLLNVVYLLMVQPILFHAQSRSCL